MRDNPYIAILLGFAVVIILGTALLSLPASTVDGRGLPLDDAFFTATSATCVTGLSTVAIGKTLTPMGQVILLVMIQVGGLGLMTLSTFFGLLLGIHPRIQNRIVIKEALNQVEEFHVKYLLRRIIVYTLGMETVGAIIFAARTGLGTDPAGNIFAAVFHSVSAFCNAGFTLYSDSLTAFRFDPVINVTVMVLVVGGGIGFWVIYGLYEGLKSRVRGDAIPPHNLQTQVVLRMTAALILIGTILFMSLEGSRSGVTGLHLFWISAFQSVTTRTAGFNTVDIASLSFPTLIWIMAWMFIGASPGSTGGGVKTTTFAVMLASLRAVLTGNEKVELRKRTLPETVVRRAHAVFLASIGWVFLTVFALSMIGVVGGASTFLPILFETISAFGTVGLSMGLTTSLTVAGKLILSMTMFAGRVGPLSLILALAQKPDRALVVYPEQQLPIG
ncbi:MAG TPA: Trk family potassium uptake protein [Proteobacteria bacterium]|nr:Ktr system potassium uptake protein B [bacterium BMS3Abin14]HDL53143.1 Trk family potassium uptake protein [Pseudomonadota bacterium]